jgi:hypothetical protein
MKKLIMIPAMAVAMLSGAAIVPALVTAAHAADFKVSKPPKGQKLTIVYLDGDIVEGDHKKFLSVTKDLKGPVAVSLNSDGGLIGEGLNIGIDIHAWKWRTIARDCYSVCANIWLAGVERGVSKDTSLGFHSAYKTKEDGTHVIETGSGNAIVGAYLARMGFGYDFIGYATSAKPDDIEMFGPDQAKKYNVTFTFIKS